MVICTFKDCSTFKQLLNLPYLSCPCITNMFICTFSSRSISTLQTTLANHYCCHINHSYPIAIERSCETSAKKTLKTLRQAKLHKQNFTSNHYFYLFSHLGQKIFFSGSSLVSFALCSLVKMVSIWLFVPLVSQCSFSFTIQTHTHIYVPRCTCLQLNHLPPSFHRQKCSTLDRSLIHSVHFLTMHMISEVFYCLGFVRYKLQLVCISESPMYGRADKMVQLKKGTCLADREHGTP